MILSEREVDALRRIADRLRQEGVTIGYGYFPGGDPRNFTPDAECCTETELKNYERAVELLENGKIDEASGQHHWPIFNDKGERIGHTTAAPFGMGTYNMIEPEIQDLADRLDKWLDDARDLDATGGPGPSELDDEEAAS